MVESWEPLPEAHVEDLLGPFAQGFVGREFLPREKELFVGLYRQLEKRVGELNLRGDQASSSTHPADAQAEDNS